MLGDPGTAKSQLLKFVERCSPIGVSALYSLYLDLPSRVSALTLGLGLTLALCWFVR